MTYTMLAWYGPDILDKVAAELSLDPVLEAHDDATFRDAAGAWWRPQRDRSWLMLGSVGWQRATRPGALEGVAPLPMGIVASHTFTLPDEPAEPTEDVSALVALARCVERVDRSYRAGEVVSTMGELILSDWMLLTTDGRLWTVGVQSGSWFTFGRHGWEPESNPPAGPFVTGADAEAIVQGAASPARQWAEGGRVLPEPLTPEWRVPEPPDSFETSGPEPPSLPIDELPPQ